MNILFIAPIPPPINGNSLAAKVFRDKLEQLHRVVTVNAAKTSHKVGVDSFGRLVHVARMLHQVWRESGQADVVYLTVSESSAGNLKDFFTYLLCWRKLDRLVIHVLGGSGLKTIVEGRGIRSRVNRFFIRRLGGVVVEGPTQAAMFRDIVAKEKVHVIFNFAEDFLFVEEQDVVDAFKNVEPLNILFLSNLIPGKGYEELAEAYLGLPEQTKKKVKVSFVGGFESDAARDKFLARIAGQEGLRYLGRFVSGSEKKALYASSHVFCLPTYYPYEGQPIALLEAYASGLVAITTDHGGIRDVFCDGVNGLLVEKRSVLSLRNAISSLCSDPRSLLSFARTNRSIALTRFRTSTFQQSLLRVIEAVGASGAHA